MTNGKDDNEHPPAGGGPVADGAVDVTVDVAPDSWDSFSPQRGRPVASGAMPVPEQIGRYRVHRRLGMGGMAEVFLAEQSGPAGFAKRVVVKRMLPHLTADARVVELFLREARIAARLTHPNIVQTYELGEDDGRYFIAMEFVDGISVLQLAKRLWAAKRALPIDVIRRIVGDAALGLHCAHELRGDDGAPLGVVHRDISPDNLMVTREGVTKVLDFGIAKPTSMPGLTRVGEVKGKVPFMAPEVLRGEPLDRRTDLYALGVSLYWLLTGRRPFRGDNEFATAEMVLRRQPEPPSKLVQAIPIDVDELVMRLLAKDKEERVATGLELHRLLTRNLAVDTTVVQRIVESALELPDRAVAELPSTLGTTPNVTEPEDSVRTPRRAWRSLLLRHKSATAVGAGAAAVLAAAVVVAVALSGGGPVSAPAPASAPEAVAASVAAPPKVAETADDATVADDDGAGTDATKTPTIASEPPASPATFGATIKIAATAPAHIVWRTLGGAELGRGTTALRLAAGTRTILAVDVTTGGNARVPVAPAVDYRKLPSGTLEIRAFPFADVELGKEKLGTTPVAPRNLVAGTYQITLRFQGRVVKRTVKVEPGKIQRVMVKMNEP